MAPSHVEIRAELCAPGQLFEMVDVEIRGVPLRAWKNAAACLGDVLERGKDAGGARLHPPGKRACHARRAPPAGGGVRIRRSSTTSACVAATGSSIRDAQLSGVVGRVLRRHAVGAVAVPLNVWWNGRGAGVRVADGNGASVLVADGERLERLVLHVQQLGDVRLVGTRLDDRKGAAELPAGVVDFAGLTGYAVVAATGRPDVVVEPDDDATHLLHVGHPGPAEGRARDPPQHLHATS